MGLITIEGPSELKLKYVIVKKTKVNAMPTMIMTKSLSVRVRVGEGFLLPKIFLVIPSLFLGEAEYSTVESAAQFVRMYFNFLVQESIRVRRFKR